MCYDPPFAGGEMKPRKDTWQSVLERGSLTVLSVTHRVMTLLLVRDYGFKNHYSCSNLLL